MDLVTPVFTADDVRGRSVESCGFDRAVMNFTDTEVLAALVRRAASFLTPCSPRTLREGVVSGLTGLVPDVGTVREQVDDVVEALAAYGDLLELPARGEEMSGTMLYLAPPSFLTRPGGRAFVFGIAPDGRALLPTSVARRVRARQHTRCLDPLVGEDLDGVLRGFGLLAVPERLWWKRPKVERATSVVARYDRALDLAGMSCGDVPGLQVLDSAQPVRYYRGRWRAPGRLTGRFVARREQRYGAPAWCYIELAEGAPTRLHDIGAGEWRACDEAWRLQLAIDAVRGTPQCVRSRPAAGGAAETLCFYSPLPRWARMRYDVIGEPIAERGALFAYRVPAAERRAEHDALTHELWLQIDSDGP